MNNLTLEEKYKSNDVQYELSRNFIEYAVAVNSDRSIPDAKSGLKPVAKRILWSAYETGRTSAKPHVKCARIVGDTMGAYHPHGDSSIYGALVRLSQDWVLRYPLIDFHGSNGNIAGDGPAAARYTEARLSKLAEDGMLYGLKKKNVDFIDNYDETLDEPVTLPAIFPNLLCNPNTGIGVAMACNWLPHNLNEVAQAINDYLDGKEPMLPGPDFPTGGLIINQNDLPNIIKTGHGSVKVRGKYKIDKRQIVFYEIPYGVSTESLLAEIGKACEAKEIEGITDIRDESNKKGLRIVFECSKDIAPEAVVMQLFAKTDLQTSISYNQVALIDKTPTELGLKDCIKIYVEHNIDCICREAKFDLEKALARKEIVDGLIKALEDIDNVIAIIKKSESAAKAKIALMEAYKFTDAQAQAIVDMKLGRLANLEKIELQEERKELEDKINLLNSLISSHDLQEKELRSRLAAIVKKYGDARRTELTHIDIKPEEKEKANIIPEDVAVIVSQNGEIKRIPSASFKVQKRKGKGIKTEDQTIMTAFATNTLDTLLIFSSKGKMYRTVVNNVPVGTNSSKGTPIASLIKLDDANEKIVAVTSLATGADAKYIIFVTKNGMIKKSTLEEYFKTKRNSGILAINLKEGDSIASIAFVNEEDMVLASKKGFASHIKTSDIAPTGRVTLGVKGMKLEENDYILSAMVVEDESEDIATFLSSGEGKRVSLKELPPQGRNGKGLTIFKPQGSEELINVLLVTDENNLLIIGKPNSICISAKDLPVMTTRTAKGNLLIENSKIVSVTKI